MRKTLPSRLACLLVLILSLEALAAQAAGGDPRGGGPASYSFGLAALSGEDLPSEDRAFLTRFPSLVLAALVELPPRLESFGYRGEVADRKRLNDRLSLGTALQKSLEDSSAIPLDTALSWYNRGDRIDKAHKALDKARADLAASLDAPVAEVPEKTDPLEIKAAAKDFGLLDLKGDDPLRAGRKQGVDLVVVGRASLVGAYLEVSLDGFDTKLGRQVLEWKGYADPQDPSPLAADFASVLLDTLVQSAFGSLMVKVDPPFATIQIDRAEAGSSPLGIYRFEASTLALDIWAPGYRPFHENLSLIPGSKADRKIELAPATYGRADIKTDPAASSLFLDGRELPSGASIPLSGARDIIVVDAPGHESANLILPAEGRADLSLRLRPKDGTTPAGRAEKAKDDFYSALGFVAIGLPLSELALGLRNQYVIAQAASGSGFATETTVSTAVFWGAALATAGLGANAIWKLIVFIAESSP